jgi:hypothetical protein
MTDNEIKDDLSQEEINFAYEIWSNSRQDELLKPLEASHPM